MEKISTCLWFNGQAEEAAKFYTSIFKGSRIDKYSYYGAESHGPEGSVMTVTFQLNGMEFMALNGGPEYSFTPAISLVVYCEDQPGVDYYWERLSAGGEKGVCGWLTDQFGVSWQIVPTILGELMASKDARKAENVMHALLQMTKLDIAQLKSAYEKG